MAVEGWIGVDLDGTLAFYDHWRGEAHIGRPIMPMVERVKRWLSEGKKVKVFTARASARTSDELAVVFDAINRWCEKYIGQRLEVTCTKDYAMVELWDDRAVQVRMNLGEPVGFSTRGNE
jgi:hypothetical protein